MQGVARHASAQMTFGKGAARPGFQVSLERERSLLGGELHDDIDLPWPPARRMEAAADIVRLEPGAPVAGDTGVITRRVSATAEHVDAAPRYPHARRAARLVPDGMIEDFAAAFERVRKVGLAARTRRAQILRLPRLRHGFDSPPSRPELTLGRYGGHPSRVDERAREGG